MTGLNIPLLEYGSLSSSSDAAANNGAHSTQVGVLEDCLNQIGFDTKPNFVFLGCSLYSRRMSRFIFKKTSAFSLSF